MYENIINTYLNGNISDARRAIKKLTKKQIMGLIYEWSNAGADIWDVIHKINRALED